LKNLCFGCSSNRPKEILSITISKIKSIYFIVIELIPIVLFHQIIFYLNSSFLVLVQLVLLITIIKLIFNITIILSLADKFILFNLFFISNYLFVILKDRLSIRRNFSIDRFKFIQNWSLLFLFILLKLHYYFIGKGLNLLFRRINLSPKAIVSVLLWKGDENLDNFQNH
jgi:hypothetical protein